MPDDRPAVLSWLVMHAACLHNLYAVGSDGQAPWDRIAGKRSEMAAAKLGEKVTSITKGPRNEKR